MIGPLRFLQQWLCLDNNYKRLRGSRRAQGRLQGLQEGRRANGFAHHPYGPIGRRPAKRDIVNIVGDPAPRDGARPGRARRAASRAASPIYNTEFGFQTNPPDPFVSHVARARRREILNEKEEFSYRYSRLKSYSQYLLYDDPARTRLRRRCGGPASRPACGSPAARAKPSYEAYQLPDRRAASAAAACSIWGRVRPGHGHALRAAPAAQRRLAS